MAQELIAYLNGEFMPTSQCMVSISDRGFGGDSVYDVERTFNGKIFRLSAHLDRLWRSLKYVRINPRMTKKEIAEITLEVMRRNEHLRGNADWSVAQTITRGVALGNTTGRTTSVIDDVQPTVFINVYPPPFRRYAHLHEVGIHAIIPKTRNYHPDTIDNKAKHRSRLNLTMAQLEVVEADPEAWPLLLDHYGNISEGTGSNFFIVTDGVIRTPTDTSILQGLSRDTVMMLAKDLDIPCIEEDIQPFDAYTADEAFMTGTSHSMLPISRIDWRPIGDEMPGPMVRRLLAAWSELVGLDIVDQTKALAAASE